MGKKLGRFILTVILFVAELTYFSLAFNLLKHFGIDINTYSATIKILIVIAIQIIFMLILFIIYHKDLINDLKDYKNNFKEYFSFGLKSWLIGLTIMIISNVIIYQFYQSNATNETLVQESIKQIPIYMIFSTVIYAPFTEEIIFRKSIKDFIDNNYLYIIISGLVFGYIHTLANYTNPYELLYIIPYGAVGSSFAYIYSKKKNIFVPITFHMLHNAIIVSTSLLSYFMAGALWQVA